MSDGRAAVRARTGGVHRSQRLVRNLRLLVAFRVLQMTMFPIAIVPLYWRDDLHFSMTDIFVIHAAFGLFAALFEFPGGYIADRLGYRRSMGIATVCSATAWIVLGSAESMATVLAGEVLLAMSLSLTSGTDAALCYESLLELGREGEFARWFGRARSAGAVGEGTAALAAGLLYVIWPPLPFFLQSGLWVCNMGIAFLLVEPKRELEREAQRQQTEVTVAAKVKAIFHYAAIGNPQLRSSIAVVLALGLSSFIPVWIVAIYAENAGVSIQWIGPIWAAANYAVAFGHWVSDRVGAAFGVRQALFGCVALMAVGYAGLGISHALFGFAFYYAICLARGLNGPILSHVQQRLIPSADRASLLSINSLLFRATFFVLGPIIGLGMDRMGEHAVLMIAGGIMLPLCALSIALMKRHEGEHDDH